MLITMETAMTLMENEKPVYPLEIISLLREQRAMLVQAPVQTHPDMYTQVYCKTPHIKLDSHS